MYIMNQNKQDNKKDNKKDNNYETQTKMNVMDLEKLKIEYQTQLTAYKQAVSNYVNFLQTNKTTPSYTSIKGRAFWGTGTANSQSVYTGGDVEQCKALCNKISNCTGATFNPTVYSQPMCWIRTGDGEVLPALDTDYAIVPQAKQYLLIIQSINNKLLDINKKIQDISKQGEPLYNSIKTKSTNQGNELLQNYQQLVNEREKIKKMLELYQDLNTQEIDGELKINQKYYLFILLIIFVIFIIILLYKFTSIFSVQNNSSNYNQMGGYKLHKLYK